MDIRETASALFRKVGYGCLRVAKSLYVSPRETLKTEFAKKEDNDLLRLAYPLTAQDIVVDVGGYKGQWCSDIYAMYRCVVHVFEPVPEFAEFITRRFAANPEIHVYAKALGDTDGTATITLLDDGTSLYRAGGQSIPIETIAATDFFTKNGITEIALMKINIEGGEYPLLEHLVSTGFIAHIRDVQVQFHDIDATSKARMKKIQETLSKTHHPTYQYEFIWENWQRN
ncbi:MAG: FkbM family methyltransferase [Patescibacteria group bacterium]